ncbi:MAG: DUF4011 domain-containing protein, partial [Rhodovarius sp.]|nr:DUF4011 domain-containing protein [Rhodovarius sp.]
MPANPLGVEHYVFEDLRRRLLDRGRRNPLLHFPHSRRRSIIRIVDEVPDLVLEHLCNDGRFRFKALPDPENEPQDEKTPEFRAALVKARLTDPAYLEEIQKITDDDPAAEDRRIRAERGLRDRLR